MYGLCCGQVQPGLPNRMRRLRGWVLDGLDIDGQVDVYSMRCRHVQHRLDEHGLHNLRRGLRDQYSHCDGSKHMYSLCGRQVQRVFSNRLLRLRGWLRDQYPD